MERRLKKAAFSTRYNPVLSALGKRCIIISGHPEDSEAMALMGTIYLHADPEYLDMPLVEAVKFVKWKDNNCFDILTDGIHKYPVGVNNYMIWIPSVLKYKIVQQQTPETLYASLLK